MGLFDRRLRGESGPLERRVAALEQYAEYLRQQGEYGMDRTDRRLSELERGGEA